MTPRTSCALLAELRSLAFAAYSDVEQYGDGPLGEYSQLFYRYPRFTHACGREWRLGAARAYDDLIDDMLKGLPPRARCPAEEAAILLSIYGAKESWEFAPNVFDSGDMVGLPEHPRDFDWHALFDELLQDMDMDLMLDPAWDGIEDPEGELNSRLYIGDYRPEAWFDIDPGFPDRDPRSSHRS